MAKSEDFVMVKMTEAGENFAGDHGVIRVADGRAYFEFKKGEALRATRAYEWNLLLAPMKVGNDPMFEIVEAAQAEN
jgi:hypothetical protein